MILLHIALCAGLAVGQAPPDTDDGEPKDPQLIHFLMDRISANQARLDVARGKTPKPPVYLDLPETLSATLPEDEGFIRSQHIAGEDMEASVEGLSGVLSLEKVVDDDEWALLPKGARIRRDRSHGYEIWHYPAGTRLIHRIYLKSDHRLIELRLEQRLADDAGGDGPWAYGIYRPEGDSGVLKLYKEADHKRETVDLPLPNGLGVWRWKRLELSSCRSCHVEDGPGWYQYSDEDHAGPCGFVPKNHSLLTDWAARYQKRYGLYPFMGP